MEVHENDKSHKENKEYDEESKEKEQSDDEPHKIQSKKKKTIAIDISTGLSQIQCDTRKLFKHEGDNLGILPKGSIRVVINGKSGTGKSHLLRILIPMMHKPTNIIICSTVVGNDVHEGIQKYCKGEHIKYNFFLEPDEFMEHMSHLIEKKDIDDHIICIFDDFTDCHTGKDNVYHNCSMRAFSKWRNYNVSCIIITPDVIDVKTNIRNSSNIQILFPVENPYSHMEFKKVLRNRFPTMSSTYWESLYNHISTHPYTFIMFADTCEHHKFPHLRIGWKNVVYPKDETVDEYEDPEEKASGRGYEPPQPPQPKIDGRTLNHRSGYGLFERQQMYREAARRGLPNGYCHSISKVQLQRFLKYTEKNKYNGDSELLKKIIGEPDQVKRTVMNNLYRNMKGFKRAEKASSFQKMDYYWMNINDLCTQIIKSKFLDKETLRDTLRRHGIDPDNDNHI